MYLGKFLEFSWMDILDLSGSNKHIFDAIVTEQ